MAEDKKDLRPEEQGQSGPAVSEAPTSRKEEPPAQEVKTSAPVQEPRRRTPLLLKRLTPRTWQTKAAPEMSLIFPAL